VNGEVAVMLAFIGLAALALLLIALVAA